jgi:S-adenosylmethionine hydrolase
MIVLITDYGYQGPYVGQLKAKIYELVPKVTIIDLMHDLPVFNISAAASLIPAVTKSFPENTIFICVVDPGVGGERNAVLIKADNKYFIGPDNGIFNNLSSEYQNVLCWEIMWRPKDLSISFHGRDLFAPIACFLYKKELNFDTSLIKYSQNIELHNDIHHQIIYFDNFGNAITSIKVSEINTSNTVHIDSYNFIHAPVFGAVPIGEAFWYLNSIGLVEIACNQESAKVKCELTLNQKVHIN